MDAKVFAELFEVGSESFAENISSSFHFGKKKSVETLPNSIHKTVIGLFLILF